MRAVIVNPASASGRTEQRWRRIVASLSAGGEEFDVLLTTGPGHAIELTRAAIEGGARGLVVLGGDGTVGEVVAGCLYPDGSGPLADDLELSIIHQGTGGDFARGLDIPKDEAGAVEVARSGATRRVDVGVARYTDATGATVVRGFANCANVGMAAEVVQQVTGRLKRLGNSAGFAVATVGCLTRNRARPVRIRTGEGMDTTVGVVDIAVSNTRYMGGGMLVAPDAQLDDGLFDVVVIGAAARMRLLRTFPKIYSGKHVTDSLVRVERTASITIEGVDDPRAEGVVLDGEPLGTTPATFAVLPSAIGVRVPAVTG